MKIPIFVGMAKIQTTFFCQNCGAQASKWLGKCPQCGEWNTYVQEPKQKPTRNSAISVSSRKATGGGPVAVKEIKALSEERIVTADEELNRVLGGGIVPGSLILIGGEPGIGKSTLLLQMALQIQQKVLYVTGEESEAQLKMRAERIGIQNEMCFVLSETSVEVILNYLVDLQPDIVIVDSIQTLYAEAVEATPGSVSQIRESTGQLLRYAKESGVPVFLIGHITKDGVIAGPKILEHMVDTVLQFEGDRHHTYCILRGHKNRFGPAAELGIYEMNQGGLRQVNNPSEILLSQRDEVLSGIGICAAMEGLRPLLIETQALVSSAGMAHRSAHRQVLSSAG